MYKIFNKNALTRNERFQNAVVVGIAVTVGLCIVYTIICNLLDIEFEILYIGIGYLIGLAIQKAGRGVQLRFSILAAVLAALCFIVGDLLSIMVPELLGNPNYWLYMLRIYLGSWAQLNLSVLISLAFRIIGVYVAYNYARIV